MLLVLFTRSGCRGCFKGLDGVQEKDGVCLCGMMEKMLKHVVGSHEAMKYLGRTYLGRPSVITQICSVNAIS